MTLLILIGKVPNVMALHITEQENVRIE